jgi:purine nucleoside phosphorylase
MYLGIAVLHELMDTLWGNVSLQSHSSFFFCSALTEKIVAVLPEMKCPHRIEPHQIQGLDFIHIFPVIQVSIKCSKLGNVSL